MYVWEVKKQLDWDRTMNERLKDFELVDLHIEQLRPGTETFEF